VCPTCGAGSEHRERERALNQQHEQQRPTTGSAPGGAGSRNWVFLAGLAGFAIMSVSALNSTLNPRPDGRLLNTAPALGFDVFLPIGLIGIGYCAFRFFRGRS
jgi:hypothetical protein